jgi:3-hydroxyacyl-[acyl-carrier-protein] dehydratase
MEKNDFNVNLGIKEIKEIIPHRYPFLLIDRVVYMEPGKKVIAIKNVTANEQFFQGHFPEEPVMPGVLTIEALAQAGAVAILSKDQFKNKIAFFGGINRAKFRKKIVPGDTLTLVVEIVKMKGPAGIGKAVAYVKEEKTAEAELMFMIGDKN